MSDDKKQITYFNEVKLTLNAASDPEEGANNAPHSVFAIHNLYRGKDRDRDPMPINIKGFGDAGKTILDQIKKGYRFTVEGELDYFESEKGGKYYSIKALSISDIIPPKSKL